MNKKQFNFEEIFQLLKEELEDKKLPVVADPDWDRTINTPFKTLISCILSLRTKDMVTEKAAYNLLKKYNTPEKIIKLSEEQIQDLIYPVGFYKVKSKTIKNISKTLIDKYGSVVPDDINELLKLKGVGRKTANIVMVYGFNKTGFLPIDTHCHRIPNRLGWIKTKNPVETEQKLRKILPQKYWDDFNHLFVKFGQIICLPVSPYCSRCPIEEYCKKNGLKNSR